MSAKYEIEDAEVIRATERALLVRAPELDDAVWIPLSQVHDDSEVWDDGENSGPGLLVVSAWFAEQRGWQ